jgi:hypothetical protein
MEPTQVADKRKTFSPIGILLVILGTGLLLSRLQVVPFRWSEIVWLGSILFGLTLLIRALVIKTRRGVFFGAFLAFLGTTILLRRWDLIDPFPIHWPADLLLILAASFFVLYLFDIRRIGILIPVFIFGGTGTLYYLWWMDLLDLYDVRMYVKTYWPIILILFGFGVLLRKK